MLRLTAAFLIIGLLLTVQYLLVTHSSATVTRLTNTAEHAINLNPTLSDDGRIVAFESSADLFGTGETAAFRAVRAELNGVSVFESIGHTRAVAPAFSSDGKILVFASTEDLVGQNADRNSEIFLFDGSVIKQLTNTQPDATTLRLSDGNLQPSVTSDGRTIVFSSNRDLCGANPDLTFEIFLYDTLGQRFVQLTDGANEYSAVSPKISGDGSRVYYKRTTAATPGAGDLVLIDTKTGASQVVAAAVPDLSITDGRAISNDGMRAVYSAEVAPNQSQVFVSEARDNSIRQVTQLGSRSVDVKLQATISGDGKRIAFATRRRVLNASDGGVELYLLDLPTGQFQQITNAPSSATAEVVASLNFDGSLVAFNFARILS